jgi:hypothetical protein
MEPLLVGRPSESKNRVGMKLGELMSGFAIERLQPEVVDILFVGNGICQSLPVGSKLNP